MRRSRWLNAVLVAIVSLTLSLSWVSFALAWDDDGGSDCCDVYSPEPPSPPDPPEAYSPPDPPYIEPVYSPPDPPAPEPVYSPPDPPAPPAPEPAYVPPDPPAAVSTPPDPPVEASTSSAGQTVGATLPYDYYELSLSAFGLSASFTVDRYGNVYQGAGGGVMTPAPGATLFGGIIMSEPSTPQNVSNFIQNWTVTTGGAYGYGDAVTYSGFSGVPFVQGDPTQIAFLQGVGTPSAFATATYSQQTTYGNLLAQGATGLLGANPLPMIIGLGMIGLSLYLRSKAP